LCFASFKPIDAERGAERQLSLNAQRQQRVGSTSWQGEEAAVLRRLTLERQVTSTLLPDCAIKPPAALAENRKSAKKKPSRSQ